MDMHRNHRRATYCSRRVSSRASTVALRRQNTHTHAHAHRQWVLVSEWLLHHPHQPHHNNNTNSSTTTRKHHQPHQQQQQQQQQLQNRAPWSTWGLSTSLSTNTDSNPVATKRRHEHSTSLVTVHNTHRRSAVPAEQCHGARNLGLPRAVHCRRDDGETQVRQDGLVRHGVTGTSDCCTLGAREGETGTDDVRGGGQPPSTHTATQLMLDS